MYYVYLLKSRKNGKYYIGHTKNLKERILRHNTDFDKRRYTYGRGPWSLVFYEVFNTRSEAMRHERFLKTGKGREYIKNKVGDSIRVWCPPETEGRRVNFEN